MATKLRAFDERTARKAQMGLVVTMAAALGILSLVSETFRSELGQVISLLSSGDLEAIRDYILSYGIWAPVVSLALMVLQAIAAPIPSFLVSFVNGMVFGVFWGWVLSATGHVLAAAICFWLARTLGQGVVTALIGRTGLSAADRWFARWGAWAILATRLIPGISFDVISYAAGLTRMSFWRFIGATTLGVLPGTLVHSYLGHQAPQYGWIPVVATGLVAAAGGGAALWRWWRRATAARSARVDRSGVGELESPRRSWRLRSCAQF